MFQWKERDIRFALFTIRPLVARFEMLYFSLQQNRVLYLSLQLN